MFKLGDIVKVIDIGKVYFNYKRWADKYGLTKFVYQIVPDEDQTYKIVVIAPHFEESEKLLCGIVSTSTKQEFIIGKEGIELVSKKDDKVEVSSNYWNTKCPICNASAYQGLFSLECSKNCR